MKTRITKLGMIAVFVLSVSALSAQTTTGDIAKQDNAKLSTFKTSVKLVDNKGTIKYLQAANGLTSLTNETASGGVVTTWQLGGLLTADTYIDASGKAFALDGLTLVTTAAAASTNATDVSVHGGTNTGTGFTVLIRDEASGAIQKIKLADLLKVEGIRLEKEQATNADADVEIAVAGLPTLDALTTAAKLFVYRNGVKLRFDADFLVAEEKVTIKYDAENLPMYAGDIIEIQYIK